VSGAADASTDKYMDDHAAADSDTDDAAHSVPHDDRNTAHRDSDAHLHQDNDPDTHLHRDRAPDTDFDPETNAGGDPDILTGSA
jgi:hypothetical protein